mgnify:CR=1 FL=1
MPGRKREPSFQLASGTTNERDNSYNISNTLGSIFYNTDTSNVEIRHEDPSNNVGWRDLVMNNKEQIDISGKLVVNGDVSFNAHLSAVDASFQNNVDISGKLLVDGDVSFCGKDLNMDFGRTEVLLAGAGGLDGTGGAQGTATASSYFSGTGYAAPAAFNNSLTQYDSWHSKTSNYGIGPQGMPQSIEFEFPYNVIVTKYKIWPRNESWINPKAWTLQAYPAGPYDRMYPPTRNLPSTSHRILGETYGNGTYVTNQSEIYHNNSIYGPWNAFKENGSVAGVHFAQRYTSSGSYNHTNYLVTGYNGDWLTIELPVQINLTKYGFKIRTPHTNRAPGQYKIYGSNNGSNWTELVHKTSTITYNGNYFEERILESEMYNHFGLVVNKLSGSDSYLNFDEWYIYGNEYNPVEIDSLSNITNWPIPTTDSITNDTSFNEYPVANTTTAYRKFELNITDTGGNNYVTIGELAFYGYRKGTINAGDLVADTIQGNNLNAGDLVADTIQGNHLNRGGRVIFSQNGSYEQLTIAGSGGGVLYPRFYIQGGRGAAQNAAGIPETRIILRGRFDCYEAYATTGPLTSDDRIKENEKLIVNATESLSKLTPQIYDKYLNMDLSGSFFVESGLIAQEVYYNAPELRHLVTLGKELDTSGNEYTPTPEEMDLSDVDIANDPDYGSHGWSKTENSSLNYQGLIAYLIKSNQEMSERIETLKRENIELKRENIELKTENTEQKGQIIQLTTDISMIRKHIGI